MKEWIRKYFGEIVMVMVTAIILTCGAVYDYSNGRTGGLTLSEMEAMAAEYKAQSEELHKTQTHGGEME